MITPSVPCGLNQVDGLYVITVDMQWFTVRCPAASERHVGLAVDEVRHPGREEVMT